jgi:hypothetical protein
LQIIQAVILVLVALALAVIVLGALKNIPRRKKGKYRFTNSGKSEAFEGPGSKVVK